MARTGANILDREREAVEYLRRRAACRAAGRWFPSRCRAVAPNARCGAGLCQLLHPDPPRDLVTSATFVVGRCAGIREGYPERSSRGSS